MRYESQVRFAWSESALGAEVDLLSHGGWEVRQIVPNVSGSGYIILARRPITNG